MWITGFQHSFLIQIHSFCVNFDWKYLESYAFAQEINFVLVFSTLKLTIKFTLFLQTGGGPKKDIYK